MNDPLSSQHSAHIARKFWRGGEDKPLIGVVGPCGSGKSTLITGLQAHGYRCRHIAQEHSYVPAMWQLITKPDLLIYLHCSFENSTLRRKLDWQRNDYEEQIRRLAHAHQHASIIIDTDSLTADEVLARALDYLKADLL